MSNNELKPPFTTEQILDLLEQNDYIEVLLPSGALGDNMLKVWGTIGNEDVKHGMSKAKNGIFPIRARKAYWGDRSMTEFLKIRVPKSQTQIPEEMMDKKLENSVKDVDDGLKLETSSTGGVAGYMLPMGMRGPGKNQDVLAKEKGYSILKPIEKRDPVNEAENLQESSYFNSSSSLTAEQKIETALNEIRSAMIQTERLVRHSIKLEQNGSSSAIYSEKTKKSLMRISERAIRLISLLENIKGL